MKFVYQIDRGSEKNFFYNFGDDAGRILDISSYYRPVLDWRKKRK